MQITHQIPEVGATLNSRLPLRDADPWYQNPLVDRLVKKAKMPESHAVPHAKYVQLSALVEWGAIDYEGGSLEEAARALQQLPFDPALGVNLQIFRAFLRSGEDLIIRLLYGPEGRAILLLGIDGLLDTDRLERSVIRPLVQAAQVNGQATPVTDPPPGGDLFTWLQQQGLSTATLYSLQKVGDGVTGVLQGDLLLLVDGFASGAILSLRGWRERSISEPTTEPSIRAPKEGFTESIRTMTALVRRRIRSPHLRIERFVVGVQSPTAVDLLYIQGIASPDLIHEARARLERIQVDRLKTAAMLEELVEDQPSAFFPMLLTTERPERVAEFLMEGKIAFMIDGYQNAKIAPVSFGHFMPSPDDYEERFWYSSFVIWIRFFFLGMVVIVPSFYVATMSVHPDLLPTRILISLAAARLGIPYPTIVEVLILEFFFEGMREATALLPRTVGGAITVVGGLVIGEGAIRSGLASPATVVVVALTGLAAFTVPNHSLTLGLRVLRFGLLVMSSIFGLYGLMAGLLFLILHLAALRSFGRPYLQPFSPFEPWELFDSLVRAPFWLLKKRPKGNRPLNRRRSADWLRPTPKQ